MDKNQAIARMKELIPVLTEAGKAYYQESREIMSNLEYDRLYDELLELEKQTGTILSSSPTQKVGYQVISELPKEAHESPMLSLDKTKEVEVLKEWLGDQKGLLPPKLEMLSGLMITYYTDIRSQLLAQRVDERYIPIIEYAAQNGSINNSDVQNLLNTSKTTAYRILSQLDNWLEIQGTTGKGTHYTLKGFTKGS